MNNLVKKFLKESNLIEEVRDKRSLDQALLAHEYLSQFDFLREQNLLKAHDILMQYHLPESQRGHYRTVLVRVGSRICPSPEYVVKWMPHMMNAISLTANHKVSEEYPEHKLRQQLMKDHIQFEKIHPFIDGNGRIGRLVLLWGTLRVGLIPQPILYSERQSYYRLFYGLEGFDL